MSIDYQQILMDMNRPRRRQGNSRKKIIGLLFILLALLLVAGGGYALWRYEIVGKTWSSAKSAATGLYDRYIGGETAVAAAVPQDGEVQQHESRSSAPVSLPAPPADGPIDVASQSSRVSTTSLRPAASAVAVQSAAPVVSAPQAQPVASRPAVSQNAGAGMAPTPVLSDAMAQIKVVDQLLASNPAEAMRRIEDLIAGSRLQGDEAAEAGYRLGYAARMLKDEAKAEKSWKETAENFPNLRGGRYSALALADTWYQRYAGDRPQISHWDDIQLLYSRVLGQDDAPFLPDNVKTGVKSRLNHINDALLFGSSPTKLARYHRVEQGELLGSIGNKYRVDYESIARVNGINPNRIRPGMDLKIIVGDVSVVVRKNEKSDKTPTVTWFLDGRWAREYPACVGDGAKTPAGTYELSSKERDPSWTNPVNGQLLPNDHPENILGSRWMAMRGMNTQGLGIHGTTVDDSIPGYTSAGCIRLLNKDVEELFSYARIGGKVTVLE